MSSSSLIKGNTPTTCMLCFVLINTFYVFGSCFRTLAVILDSDFSTQCLSKWNKRWLGTTKPLTQPNLAILIHPASRQCWSHQCIWLAHPSGVWLPFKCWLDCETQNYTFCAVRNHSKLKRLDKQKRKTSNLQQLAKQGSCRWLPGHQCDDAGDEDDAGVDGSGDGVLHHPVRVGWVVKGEENGIGDDAEHPEDDEADHQHKPLQPHLTTSTMQLITGGKGGRLEDEAWGRRQRGRKLSSGKLLPGSLSGKNLSRQISLRKNLSRNWKSFSLGSLCLERICLGAVHVERIYSRKCYLKSFLSRKLVWKNVSRKLQSGKNLSRKILSGRNWFWENSIWKVFIPGTYRKDCPGIFHLERTYSGKFHLEGHYSRKLLCQTKLSWKISSGKDCPRSFSLERIILS